MLFLMWMKTQFLGSFQKKTNKRKLPFPSEWTESHKSAAAVTNLIFWMDTSLFVFLDPFKNKTDVTQSSDAFSLRAARNTSNMCFCACVARVVCISASTCVCTEALIRGLERYSGGPCPPLLSSLSWLAGCPHYCQSASGLAVPGSCTALCPLCPASTSLPDCCHW